jgi:hypothetical protein
MNIVLEHTKEAKNTVQNTLKKKTRARILKHFMGAEKTTFRLKRYLSNHTFIFGILKHTSYLSRRVTSTAVFSLEAKE